MVVLPKVLWPLRSLALIASVVLLYALFTFQLHWSFDGAIVRASSRLRAAALVPYSHLQAKRSVVRDTPWPCILRGVQHTGASCNVLKDVPPSDMDMPPDWKPRPPSAGRSTGWKTQHSCCAFSDAYRFIYMKHAKNAGSSVLPAFLRPSICPVGDGEPRTVPLGYDTPETRFGANCTAQHIAPLDSDCFPCHDIERWKWMSYYVFSVVRHPLTRAVSSYTYCRKQAAGVPFGQWCVNPDAGGGICGADSPGRPNAHWAPQTPAMCTRDGRCIVDFIARSEHLDRDMDAVVASINALRNASYPPLPPFSARRVVFNRTPPTPPTPPSPLSPLSPPQSTAATRDEQSGYGSTATQQRLHPELAATGSRTLLEANTASSTPPLTAPPATASEPLSEQLSEQLPLRAAHNETETETGPLPANEGVPASSTTSTAIATTTTENESHPPSAPSPPSSSSAAELSDNDSDSEGAMHEQDAESAEDVAAAAAVKSRLFYSSDPYCLSALSSWYADDLELLGYSSLSLKVA